MVWSTKTAPLLQRREGAMRPECHLAEIVVIADASEDEVGAVRRLGGRRRGLPPNRATQASALARVRLNTTTSWPARLEMAGHGKAHDAEPDPGNFAHAAISPASSFRRKPNPGLPAPSFVLDTGFRRYDGARVSGRRKKMDGRDKPGHDEV